MMLGPEAEVFCMVLSFVQYLLDVMIVRISFIQANIVTAIACAQITPPCSIKGGISTTGPPISGSLHSARLARKLAARANGSSLQTHTASARLPVTCAFAISLALVLAHLPVTRPA